MAHYKVFPVIPVGNPSDTASIVNRTQFENALNTYANQGYRIKFHSSKMVIMEQTTDNSHNLELFNKVKQFHNCLYIRDTSLFVDLLLEFHKDVSYETVQKLTQFYSKDNEIELTSYIHSYITFVLNLNYKKEKYRDLLSDRNLISEVQDMIRGGYHGAHRDTEFADELEKEITKRYGEEIF